MSENTTTQDTPKTELSMEDARAFLLADYYAKRLTDVAKDLKSKLNRAMAEGDAVAVRVPLPDGTEATMGRLSKSDPKLEWKVTDPQALLEYALESDADLVEQQWVLNAEGVQHLLKAVAAKGEATDQSGREVPGITRTRSTASMRPTPAKDLLHTLDELAEAGTFKVEQLLQLERGR